jgi:hypothetical protein
MNRRPTLGILDPLASERGGQMLHWRSRLTYLAVVAAVVIGAFGGDFEGWAW